MPASERLEILLHSPVLLLFESLIEPYLSFCPAPFRNPLAQVNPPESTLPKREIADATVKRSKVHINTIYYTIYTYIGPMNC